MKLFGEPDERKVWQAALAPTPECIPIPKLAEPLSETDAKHLAACPRCQSELTLWREFNESAPRAEEGAAVAWISGELRRRSAVQPPRARSWWRRWAPVPSYRWSAGLAAVLLIAASVALYNSRTRRQLAPEPAGEGALRSQGVAVVSPLGDLDVPPAELSWQAVAGAASYQVQILEVDRHVLWETETRQSHIAIPDDIRTAMWPGKTLIWEVTARNSSGAPVAASGPRRFRVKVKKIDGGDL